MGRDSLEVKKIINVKFSWIIAAMADVSMRGWVCYWENAQGTFLVVPWIWFWPLSDSTMAFYVYIDQKDDNQLRDITYMALYQSETRTPGPETSEPWDSEHGTPSKFKSGTPGPPLKLKSGTLVIIILHCLTYFVLDKYIYTTGQWTTCKRGLHVKSYCFFETRA